MSLESETVALDIPGTWNARDTATLAKTAPGVLFRSAHLAGLDDDGRAALRRLGVTDVVDLRTPHEVHTHGQDAVPPGVTEHPLPIHPGSAIVHELTHHVPTLNQLGHAAAAALHPHLEERGLEAMYADIVTDPEAVRQIGAALKVIADAPGAVLVHCSAGKDRTGLVCALAEQIAGAKPEDIDADYLRSNAAVPEQARLVPGEIPASLRGAIAPLLGVDIDSLDAARAAVERHYGGLAGFLDAAGVSQETVSRLRARLAPPTRPQPGPRPDPEGTK